MCRYSHRSGACANRHVDSLECMGEENCAHSQTNTLMLKGSTSPSSGFGLDKWFGLYCERHGRFFCSGKEDCATAELYMRRLSGHQMAFARRPEDE